MEQTIECLENCVELLRRGALTESDLESALVAARAAQARAATPGRQRQSLMFAASANTDVFSPLLALSIVRGGRRLEIPREAWKWPFGSVADAIGAGWRVIVFPTYPVSDEFNAGLGCEYILEKWEDPADATP